MSEGKKTQKYVITVRFKDLIIIEKLKIVAKERGKSMNKLCVEELEKVAMEAKNDEDMSDMQKEV